jgi:hypothetical protein
MAKYWDGVEAAAGTRAMFRDCKERRGTEMGAAARVRGGSTGRDRGGGGDAKVRTAEAASLKNGKEE